MIKTKLNNVHSKFLKYIIHWTFFLQTLQLKKKKTQDNKKLTIKHYTVHAVKLTNLKHASLGEKTLVFIGKERVKVEYQKIQRNKEEDTEKQREWRGCSTCMYKEYYRHYSNNRAKYHRQIQNKTKIFHNWTLKTVF